MFADLPEANASPEFKAPAMSVETESVIAIVSAFLVIFSLAPDLHSEVIATIDI